MGADRAIVVPFDKGEIPTLSVAKIFGSLIAQEKPEIVLLGKQAIDDDSNQTGQILAGLLKWPQVCVYRLVVRGVSFCSDTVTNFRAHSPARLL
jgi:electron transfer flavoprotein beta subunit